MTTTTDTPWWQVRRSLAITLGGSLATATAAYTLIGALRAEWLLSSRSIETLFQALGSTPALAMISLAACVALPKISRRPLRVLCSLLALAALTGATLNLAREAAGRGIVETWLEKALIGAPTSLASSRL